MRLCLIIFLILSFQVQAAEKEWDGIAAIGQNVLRDCGSSGSFMPLFDLAVSGQNTGVSHVEYVSEVTEEVFLACPFEFLSSLMKLVPGDRKAVLRYFGVVHAPWELGAELRKWQQDGKVGEFVKTEFSGFLVAKSPDDK